MGCSSSLRWLPRFAARPVVRNALSYRGLGCGYKTALLESAVRVGASRSVSKAGAKEQRLAEAGGRLQVQEEVMPLSCIALWASAKQCF